jgi:hypothetical protein
MLPPLHQFQYKAIESALRGEEKAWFKARMRQISKIFDAMPKIYEQDGKGNEAIAYLHYFNSSWDWYITEKDAAQKQGFGLVRGFETELGYIDFVEITKAGAELDLHFEPTTLGEIRERLEKSAHDSWQLQEEFKPDKNFVRNFTQEALRQMAENDLLPADYDDWGAKIYECDGTYRTVAHICATRGTLPDNYEQWDIADWDGETVAHTAAAFARLPDHYNQWWLKNKESWTVAHEVVHNRRSPDHLYNAAHTWLINHPEILSRNEKILYADELAEAARKAFEQEQSDGLMVMEPHTQATEEAEGSTPGM